jgi:hypothetical protein
MGRPIRPSQIFEPAEKALQALSAAGLGQTISVGGAFGLQHYFEYRSTDDVDAWWAPSVASAEREQVLQTIEEALRPFGEIRVRAWGEVVSVELKRAGKTVFSFQIAARSAQLEPTTMLPWTDVGLDSLPDLIASKMVALVERGAPRDFRDIYTLCQAGLTSAAEAWRLWMERQRRAGSDIDLHRARLAIETHLARIAEQRPLDAIPESERRAEAERVRTWFATELLHADVD